MNKLTLNRLLDIDSFNHKDIIKIRKLIDYNLFLSQNGMVQIDVSLKNSKMGRIYTPTITERNLEDTKTRIYKDICVMLINDRSLKKLINKEISAKIIEDLELVKIKDERQIASVFFNLNGELYLFKQQSPLVLDHVKSSSLINAIKMIISEFN